MSISERAAWPESAFIRVVDREGRRERMWWRVVVSVDKVVVGRRSRSLVCGG